MQQIKHFHTEETMENKNSFTLINQYILQDFNKNIFS